MSADKGGGVRPSTILAGRYGLTKGVDIGGHLEPSAGFSGDATLQIVTSKVVDLAVGPGFGYFQTPGPITYQSTPIAQYGLEPLYTIWSANLPVLFGYNFGQGHQVVVAPRASWYFVQPNGGPGGVETFLGGSLGVSLKVSRTIRVMPEVAATVPVNWTGESAAACTNSAGTATASCAAIDTTAVIIQGGFGITVGEDNLGR